MKRIISTMIIFSLLLTSVAACGTTKDYSDATGPKATTQVVEQTNIKPEEEIKKVNLQIWQYKQELVDFFPQITDAYSKVNPNVTITTERPGGDQFYATIKTLLAAGDVPDIVMVGTGDRLKEYYTAGKAVDLTNEKFTSKIIDSIKSDVTIDGKVIAIPLDIAAVGVIYDKKAFASAGITEVPKTVTQLKSACKKLKDKGIVPFALANKDAWTLRFIFAIGHTSTVDITTFANEMNSSTGSFKNDKMDKVFEVFDTIGTNANSNPFDSDYNNQCTLLAQGKAAMIIQGLWALQNIQKVNPQFDGGMFALPTSENAEDTRLMTNVDATFIVYADSKKIDESKKFLDWFTSKEATDMWSKNYISTFKGTTAPKLLGTAAQDIMNYVSDNKTFPWGFLKWPAGYDLDVAGFMQMYYLNKLTKAQFYDTLQKTWKKYLKN